MINVSQQGCESEPQQGVAAGPALWAARAAPQSWGTAAGTALIPQAFLPASNSWGCLRLGQKKNTSL